MPIVTESRLVESIHEEKGTVQYGVIMGIKRYIEAHMDDYAEFINTPIAELGRGVMNEYIAKLWREMDCINWLHTVERLSGRIPDIEVAPRRSWGVCVLAARWLIRHEIA